VTESVRHSKKSGSACQELVNEFDASIFDASIVDEKASKVGPVGQRQRRASEG
jgi:hypothetical protein